MLLFSCQKGQALLAISFNIIFEIYIILAVAKRACPFWQLEGKQMDKIDEVLMYFNRNIHNLIKTKLLLFWLPVAAEKPRFLTASPRQKKACLFCFRNHGFCLPFRYTKMFICHCQIFMPPPGHRKSLKTILRPQNFLKAETKRCRI